MSARDLYNRAKLRHLIKPHKYNARKTERDGMKFDSQKEARRYDQLKLLLQAGDIVMFLRQVPFHLPGGVTYRVDFQIFWENGRVTFEDTKGYVTDEFKKVKKMVEAIYPVEIEVS